MVTHYVNDHAIGVSYKKRRTPHGSSVKGLSDLKIKHEGLGMHCVNVRDLNGQSRLWCRRSGFSGGRDLSCRIACRCERDNRMYNVSRSVTAIPHRNHHLLQCAQARKNITENLPPPDSRGPILKGESCALRKSRSRKIADTFDDEEVLFLWWRA